MLANHHNDRSTSGRLMDRLGLRTLFAFFSVKALRGAPRLLPQIAAGVVFLVLLARILPAYMSEIAFGKSYTRVVKWKPSGGDDGSIGGGLRVVVFGGSDIATPAEGPIRLGGQNESWTEVMCQQVRPSIGKNFKAGSNPSTAGLPVTPVSSSSNWTKGGISSIESCVSNGARPTGSHVQQQ